MFGVNNEPSTLDEFNKILPAWYSEYDLGTVVTTPAQITVTSRGANLFNINSVRGELNDLGIKDPYSPGVGLGNASSCFTTMQEDTYYEGLAYNGYYNTSIGTAFDILSNNTARSGSYGGYGTGFPIRIVPGQLYFLKYDADLESNGGFIGLTWRDRNGQTVAYRWTNRNTSHRAPKTAYWAVLIIQNTNNNSSSSIRNIQFFPVDDDATAEEKLAYGYRPYWKNEVKLDVSPWFPDGLYGNAVLSDFITDGYYSSAHYGIIDLGRLAWAINSPDTEYFRVGSDSTIGEVKGVDNNTRFNGFCAQYVVDTAGNTYRHIRDKSISVNTGGGVWIYDSSLAGLTATEIRDRLSGVYLIYERTNALQNTSTQISPLAKPFASATYSINPNGQEQVTTPTNALVQLNTTYYTTPSDVSQALHNADSNLYIDNSLQDDRLTVNNDFIIRETAEFDNDIGDGLAEVEEIYGRTLIYNQLCPTTAPAFANGTTEATISGITLKQQGNFSWLVNGTATADVDATFGYWNTIPQHKYWIGGFDWETEDENIQLEFYPLGSITCVDDINGKITTATTSTTNGRIRLKIPNGTTVTNLSFSPFIVDLTHMFGVGYEPRTIEECIRLIPYVNRQLDTGTLGAFGREWEAIIFSTGYNQCGGTSFAYGVIGGAVKTPGSIDNKQHGIYLKQSIAVLPNKTYGLCEEKFTNWRMRKVTEYNDIGIIIREQSQWQSTDGEKQTDYVITTHPLTRRVRIAYYNADWLNNPIDLNKKVCLHLLHSSRQGNTHYDEYQTNALSELATFVRNNFSEGLQGIGGERDKIDLVKGTTSQYFGIVDLGSLSWNVGANANTFYTGKISNSIYWRYPSRVPNMLCSKYTAVSRDFYDAHKVSGSSDMRDIFIDHMIAMDQSAVVITDKSFATAAEAKAGLAGVYLVYELKTPVVTDLNLSLDARRLFYPAWDMGIESLMPPSNDTIPLMQHVVPAEFTITYTRNLTDTLRRLSSIYWRTADLKPMSTAMLEDIWDSL